MAVLAIDQGTTATSAVVLNRDGSLREVAPIVHEQRYPQKGWVEHDPEALLRSLRSAVEAAGPDRHAAALALETRQLEVGVDYPGSRWRDVDHDGDVDRQAPCWRSRG